MRHGVAVIEACWRKLSRFERSRERANLRITGGRQAGA
jgi:hypothetical protein